MGKLVEGVWRDDRFETTKTGGAFVRPSSSFRSRVTRDGSSGYPAAGGRYHLYVSYACPWASRTLIFRKLKKLESAIGVSVVHPFMGDDGWTFDASPGATGDGLYGLRFLREIYTLAKPDYTGRVTVPVLFDRETKTIVSNESSEIIRMLNSEFDAIGDAGVDLYPEALRAEIEAWNARIYPNVNNGVYRAGFATSQEAYEAAFDDVFATLDAIEAHLATNRYLVGSRITEADWRLFTTLVRFDPVYVTHFKCNRQRLVDYPNLWGYTRELYQVPGVAETVRFDHIKRHYFTSHESINPTRVIAKGPEVDFTEPHGRAHLG